MVNKKQLEEFYKQNLENDIINTISEMKGIDLRKALDIYYSSRLSEQILNDSYGILKLKEAVMEMEGAPKSSLHFHLFIHLKTQDQFPHQTP